MVLNSGGPRYYRATTTTDGLLKAEDYARLAAMTGTFTSVDEANLDQLVQLQTSFPSVRVYHNAAQSIPNTASTQVAFNSERFDTHGFHDTVTNNGLLTCPADFAGLYLIGFSGQFAASAAGGRRIFVIDHSADGNIAWAEILPSAGAAAQVLTVLYRLAVGQSVRVLAYQDSGGALNLAAAAVYTPEFWLTRLGG